MGLTWSERLNVQVPDPGCKGGLVQAAAAKAMVISTAASCHGRVNQTVFLSTEDGAPGSWVYRQLIDAKSGYSTLQVLHSPPPLPLAGVSIAQPSPSPFGRCFNSTGEGRSAF